MSDTADFFRRRLDQMIDLGHPLAVLSLRMPFQELEAIVVCLLSLEPCSHDGPNHFSALWSGQ